MTVRRVPVVLMRGGPLRAACFLAHDLPTTPRARDALLIRALGAPDTGGCVDGPGTGPDGVSRVLVVSRSQRPDCDVDVLAGVVDPGSPTIDWSAPCGPLAAAVAPFAIAARLFPAGDGTARVRLQQVPDGARMDAFVPVAGGEPADEGGFVEDGLAHPSPEIRLERIEPVDQPFPTGAVREVLELPGGGVVDATLVAVDEPVVFVRADALGLSGREQPGELDRARRVHERIAAIRTLAAARFGLASESARGRGRVPVVCWVARPAPYRGVGGEVPADAIDLLARCDVEGRLDAAPGGRVTAEIAVAAAVPGTVVAEVARTLPGVATRIGHASGAVAAAADVGSRALGRGREAWRVDRLVRSHGARRLLAGELFVPVPAGSAGGARPAGSGGPG
ncbi:MAG: PrpF domain-containing protein [Burkholderiales bacterium]